MADITRRGLIVSASAGAAIVGLTAATSSAAQDTTPPSTAPAFAGNHKPVPLPFDAASLQGMSERLIRSHWDNNYQGSIRMLNTVEQRLATAMTDKDLPPVIYGGLKREELHRTGSVILHEIYFDGLGGDGQPAGEVVQALADAFGSIDAWEAEFRRTALALAGGSGWAILSWNRHTASLHNYWAWDHMHGAISGEPLIALDMYEHAYHLDYGTAAARYVDAFMANLHWDRIDARYKAATASLV